MNNIQIPREDRLWAAASYIWFISIIALAARRHNAFIRFHANQGLFLFVAALIFSLIPVIGWIMEVVIFVVVVCAVIQALSGKQWPLPLYADRAVQLGDWVVRVFKL
jgi:uncharacterized membrane protein